MVLRDSWPAKSGGTTWLDTDELYSEKSRFRACSRWSWRDDWRSLSSRIGFFAGGRKPSKYMATLKNER